MLTQIAVSVEGLVKAAEQKVGDLRYVKDSYPRQRTEFLDIQRELKAFLKSWNGWEEQYPHRCLIVAGIRGVGKTVLLRQIEYELFRNKELVTPPPARQKPRIFHFDGDTINETGYLLHDVILDAMPKVIFGVDRWSRVKKPIPILIVVDEAHQCRDWDSTFRVLYDQVPWVFVILSGSAALLLEAKRSLARRTTKIYLGPLRFWEYALLRSSLFPPKKLTSNLRQTIFDSFDNPDSVFPNLLSKKDEVTLYYKQLKAVGSSKTGKKADWLGFQTFKDLAKWYLVAGNIPAFFSEEESVLKAGGARIKKFDPSKVSRLYEKAREILLRVANEDAVRYRGYWVKVSPSMEKALPDGITFSENVMKVVGYLAQSLETSLDAISLKLGLKKDYVSFYLQLLMKARLIDWVSLYRRRSSGELFGRGKVYFTSPVLRLSLLVTRVGAGSSLFQTAFEGWDLEEMVYNILKKISPYDLPFFVYKVNGEADLILERADDKRIAFEIGWGKKKLELNEEHLNKFEKVFLVTNAYQDPKEIHKKAVVLPLKWFFLC